jgi:excisionase family DNA binding protein
MTARRAKPDVVIEPRALDLETAARVYALGESTLRELIDHHGFPALRIGNRIIVPVALADAWLAERAGGPGVP